MNYDYKTELYLRKCWDIAYTEGKHLVRVNNPSNPVSAVVTFNLLLNYRRSIRTLKLNPLYKDQWTRIDNCKLYYPKAGSSYIRIERKYATEFKKKLKIDYKRHPFNKFNLPKGTTNGTNFN